VFASLGAGIVAYAFLWLIDKGVPTEKLWGIFSQGLVAGLAGIVGFWLVGSLLKIEEMNTFFASMKRKLFKSAKVMAEDSINEGKGA
jgi:hypothetical protein